LQSTTKYTSSRYPENGLLEELNKASTTRKSFSPSTFFHGGIMKGEEGCKGGGGGADVLTLL
jgi:hypothetical protein